MFSDQKNISDSFENTLQNKSKNSTLQRQMQQSGQAGVSAMIYELANDSFNRRGQNMSSHR